MAEITITVNGTRHGIDADPAMPLVYVLRNVLGLTGAKVGCGLEQCGSCTVLVNGEPRPTCTAPVGEFDGTDIVTVEGLTEDGQPGPVQRAFIAEAASQCGYCTPGLVIAVEALRRRGAAGDRDAIRQALEPHLCRCGTHAAVLRAAQRVLGSDS